MSATGQAFAGPSARVIVSSTRAAAGVYPDRSGPIAVQLLAELGFAVGAPVVVADGAPLEAALREAVSDGVDVVITAGGTGLSATDVTPEITARIVERQVPGIAEAIRAAGWQSTPLAALSRGIAGTVNETLIVNLPGSASGVGEGMQTLRFLLRHAVDQLKGGDHPFPGKS
ncbi:MAG: MogA/MoaB family molybdenum cofactor biosynthesis protein [Mycobacteriales bacterium]